MIGGKKQRSHFIKFKVDHPISSKEHPLYENEFAQFGLTGLWLEYNSINGTAYFSCYEDALQAYKSLNQRNNMNMQLDPLPTRNSDDTRSDRQRNPKWKDYDNEDIETSVEYMYDVYGNKIPVLYANDNKVYVSLDNIEGCGYKLFDKAPSMQEPNEQWNVKLKVFLLHQASIFVYMNQINFNTRQVFSTVKSILNDLDITKNPPSSLNSSVSERETETRQPNNKSKVKTVTMKVNVTQKAIFLNDHVDGIYYVRLVENEDVYNKIQKDINSIPNNGQSVTPRINSVYGINYNNTWYRGTLYKSNQQDIFLIDEGKIISGKYEARLIPEELYKIPGQAIRVRLSKNYTSKEGKVMNIIATQEYADGTYLVKPTDSSGFTSDHDGSVRSFKNNKPNMSTPIKKSTEDEWEADEHKGAVPKKQNNYMANQNRRTTPQNNDFDTEQRPVQRQNISNDFNAEKRPVQRQNNSNDFSAEQKPVQRQNNSTEQRQNNSNDFNSEQRPVQRLNNSNDFNNEQRSNSFGNEQRSIKTQNNREEKQSNDEQNSVLKQSNSLMNNKPAMPKIFSEGVGKMGPASLISMMKAKQTPVVKSTRKCISEELNNTKGCMEFVQMHDSDSFIAFILPSTKFEDIMILEGISEDVQHNPSFSPSIGDTVVVEQNQEGEPEPSSVRAVLLEKIGSEYKVALIDYGKIVTVRKVSELPAKYNDIVQYAACCTVEKKYLNPIKEQLRFNYVSERNGELVIEVDDQPVKLLCGKWNPLIKTEEVVIKPQIAISTLAPANPLKPNELVKIISQENDTFAIRARENHMMLQQITDALKDHTVEPLQNAPTKNQIVLYKDTNDSVLYRAQVKQISDNLIKIFKLDYGVTDTTDVSNLYYIDKLHNFPHTLHFKTLAGFQDDYENTAVQDFLKTVFKKENFKMVSQNNNEVKLLLNDGTNLADKLKSLLTPPFKRMEDLPSPVDLPLGQSAHLMVMHIEDFNTCDVSATMLDVDVQNTFLVLAEKLLNCDDIPLSAAFHVGQVCVGKFDDAWYRAEIQKYDAINKLYYVYFFDFGNYYDVSINDLRELSEDLAKFPPLAVRCRIINIYNKYNGNLPEACKDELENLMATGITVDVQSKNGNKYNVTISELE